MTGAACFVPVAGLDDGGVGAGGSGVGDEDVAAGGVTVFVGFDGVPMSGATLITLAGRMPQYTAAVTMPAASTPIHHCRRGARLVTGLAGGDTGAGAGRKTLTDDSAAATCTKHTARRPRQAHAISASPGPTAVTNPSAETAATAGLLLYHSTAEPSVA